VQPFLVTVGASKNSPIGATTPVTFTANISPTGSSVAGYTWTFGDGTSQTTPGPGANHEYPNATPKTYTVSVEARTSTGHSSKGTTTVKIP
jgi:hypothetical protein